MKEFGFEKRDETFLNSKNLDNRFRRFLSEEEVVLIGELNGTRKTNESSIKA